MTPYASIEAETMNVDQFEPIEMGYEVKCSIPTSRLELDSDSFGIF